VARPVLRLVLSPWASREAPFRLRVKASVRSARAGLLPAPKRNRHERAAIERALCDDCDHVPALDHGAVGAHVGVKGSDPQKTRTSSHLPVGRPETVRTPDLHFRRDRDEAGRELVPGRWCQSVPGRRYISDRVGGHNRRLVGQR
jgi:hypothetical protein